MIFPTGVSDGKESACQCRVRVQALGQEDSLEKGMATHSSIHAWRIPQTEKPAGLPWGHKESNTTEQLILVSKTIATVEISGN